VTVRAALLRGINVGGKTTVPMEKLKSLFTSLGHEDVATYIQSGNVVFRSAAGNERDVAAELEQRIAETFAVAPRVLLRTPAELKRIAARNPFLERETDLKTLHVVYLDRAPAASAVAELDPDRSPPDEFRVLGREVYLHLPNGFGRSKLTIDYFEGRLGAVGTARNWRTLLKLIELSESL
jgi:uncharacterized protein (DUF1697 family)